MRLDKFLCDGGFGTRSQLKKDIRAGLVTVNGNVCRQPEQQILETEDQICYRGMVCNHEKYVYYMLHKPAGYVTATKDTRERTVMELLKAENCRDLFPVGRLDKDTEGLLLITNDGALAHALLSPRRHIQKTYECHLRDEPDEEQCRMLESGVDIGEKHLTAPAVAEVLPSGRLLLTITEGKFHQVKRMLAAVGNEVIYLKRLRMGALVLDETLPKGAYRKLTAEEISALYDKSGHI